ncbi:MAG: hypothetical protein CMN30_08940 [Sandaracinus sp.]|nr:hypothetical protein [Sandaracinus sp.]
MVLAALGAAVVLGACDCGGSDDGPGCVTASDCSEDQVCVDSRCADRPDGGGVDAAPCAATQMCGDLCCAAGEICAGGSCCAAGALCGGACCGGDAECVNDRCVLACEDDESPCGDGASAACCPAEELCYLGACTVPGAECAGNSDCADGEYCEPTVGRCLPRNTSGETCEYRPDFEEFTLTEEWSWEEDLEVLPAHDQVMMAPMVANLTDDNGDGVIDENDIPDVVFATFTGSDYWSNGVLRAVSGDDGRRLWPTTEPGYRVNGGSDLAIADVDPTSPGPEVIVCTEAFRPGVMGALATPGYLMLVAADGTELRRFDTPPNEVRCRFAGPAVGDMNRDGVPEIVVGNSIAQGDGTVVGTIAGGFSQYAALSDLDGDGDLEAVGSAVAVERDGSILWDRRTVDPADPMMRPAIAAGGYPAIADLDLDGSPEVVVITGGDHSIQALDGATGDTVWGPFDINPTSDPVVAAAISTNGNPSGGGPPTIANFDDDPEPEIAFAGGYAYVIFEHDGTLKWHFVTQDRSSRGTGSSVFDFEGDGVSEVLYNDELFLRVFRGPTGDIFHDQCNTSGTLREFPIVVDVDNDDHAEIVLMENDYAFQCASPSHGIHVFGHPDNQWVRTRRIFNQHTYHVTNIAEDGTVPTNEVPNWTQPRLNNFRQNVQPEGLFDAPDLVLVDLVASTRGCGAELDLSVRVLNAGRAGAPAGVPVTFYEGTDRVGRAVTTRALLPGESERVAVTFPIPSGRAEDSFSFTATLNAADDEPLVGLNECRTENNDAGPLVASCPIVD